MSSLGQPENFRLEVEDALATGGSVSVTLKVGARTPITYTLGKKSGNKFQGEFLRLVTDSVDVGVQGTQTVLCNLGEQVVLSYTRTGVNCVDKHTIGIGRPASENNNGTDPLKHDIRTLAARVFVFSKPGTTKLNGGIDGTQDKIKVDSVATAHSSGAIKIENESISYTGINTTTNEFTGCTREMGAPAHDDNTVVLYSTKTPAVTLQQATDDVVTANQRLAQATIKLGGVQVKMGGVGSPGNKLPPAMLDGYKLKAATHTLANLTDDEKAVALENDANPDSIDIYYVHGDLVDIDDATNKYTGYSYNKAANSTGDTNYQGFVVISNQRAPFVLAHEFLHILLDTGHPRTPVDDPGTALFHAPVSLTNVVGGTKRIGPYPGDGPGSNGTNDTYTIRETAENLP